MKTHRVLFVKATKNGDVITSSNVKPDKKTLKKFIGSGFLDVNVEVDSDVLEVLQNRWVDKKLGITKAKGKVKVYYLDNGRTRNSLFSEIYSAWYGGTYTFKGNVVMVRKVK